MKTDTECLLCTVWALCACVCVCVHALIEHLSQQYSVGMPFSLQMSKPRLRRLTSVSKDSHGVMPEPGLKCQTLTASPHLPEAGVMLSSQCWKC